MSHTFKEDVCKTCTDLPVGSNNYLFLRNNNPYWTGVETCCVQGLLSNNNAIKLLNLIARNGINSFNTLECYRNYMLTIYGSLDLSNKSNIHAADVFMKLRHDYFAKLFLQADLQVLIDKTDSSFKDLFQIDSNRTPDYIHVTDFDITIYEFAVTNSSDFADSKKGSPSDSKYDREIRILRDEGFNVQYKPIILRLDKTYEDCKKEWLTLGCDVNLIELHQTYKELSDQFYRNFSHLFSQNDNLFKSQVAEREWSLMPYRRNKFFKCNVRNKSDVILTHKKRIKEILNQFEQENPKIMLVYNLEAGTMYGSKTESGMYVSCLRDWFLSGLDTDKIIKYISYNTRGTSFETTDFGFTKKITNINTFSSLRFSSHEMVQQINDQNFEDIVNSLGLNNQVENIYGDVEAEGLFTTGVPSPFDFDTVLDESVNIINNTITNKEMLFNYKNDINTRRNIYSECMTHVFDVNDYDPNKINYPKSSFSMFLKPPGPVATGRQLTVEMLTPYLSKVRSDTYHILKLIKQLPTPEPKIATTFSQLDPLRKDLYRLVEEYNIKKSIWSKTSGCDLVHRGEIKVRQDPSIEAKEMLLAAKRLFAFQAKNSKVVRLISGGEYSHRIPIPKEASKNIKLELERYHNSKGYYGTGRMQVPGKPWSEEELFDKVRALLNDLTSVTDAICPFKVQFPGINETNPFIDQVKLISVKEIEKYEDYMSKTALGSTLEFNSILYKSVLFLSGCPFKSKIVNIETCGLKDTLLLVKGGKNTTNSSKAFKVITTINEKSIHFYNCHNDGRSSWHFFKINDKIYMETPWLRYQIGLCEHAHLCKYKFSTFYLTMSEEVGLTDIQLEKFSLPMLAMFNGRRKLEMLLGTFRQLIMNFRAEYANIVKLFMSSVEYAKDYIYYFICVYILRVLENLINQPDSMYDPITNATTKNVMSWTINMYSSRIMPKAAIDYTGELRNDIIAFLKTFDDCSIRKDTQLVDYCVNLDEDPYTHDLNFSPKLSWLVGCYVSDYIKIAGSESDIYKSFRKIYGSNIFETANNRGCRMDPREVPLDNMTLDDYLKTMTIEDFKELRLKIKREPDMEKKAKLVKTLEEEEYKLSELRNDYIFGRKGYQSYLDTFPHMNFKLITDSINAPGPVSATSMLSKDNTTLYGFYKNELKGEIPQVTASIHAKVQWLGPREIFALTVQSKIIQQLAEKCFRVLCKHLPNEMISIPSDKRTLWLHSTIHQRIKKGTYVLSLDYRRWGPHSNFLKYKYFLMGLADIIPPSFYEFFKKLCTAMENKKIIIRKEDLIAVSKHEIVKQVLSNISISYYKDYVLIKEPHSFIMGIYNYLSSLFHAGSQLLFRHLLHMSELKKNDPILDFYAIAHSDDAQGMFNCTSYKTADKIIAAYETFGRYLNHMQSNKKSQIDFKSSEVISIVRIDRKIISMIAKFASTITITPSYKGYVFEAKALTSKIIELIVNGGTFNQAYKLYRVLVYYLNYVVYHFNYACYQYPIEALGTPDDYPILQMMYGTQANFLTNYYYNREINLKVQTYAKQGQISLVEGLQYNAHSRNLRNINFEKYRELVDNTLEDFLRSDTIVMLNFRSDTLIKMQIIARMRDPNFAAAMAGGHMFTGLSYLFRNNAKFSYYLDGDMHVPYGARMVLHRIINDVDNKMTSNELMTLDYLLQELKIFEYLPNKIQLTAVETTLKPCHFTMSLSTIRGLRNIQYKKVHCYLQEPQYRNLMDLTNTEINQIKFFEVITHDMTVHQKDLLAQSVCSEGSHELYFYSSMPHDKRVIETKADLSNLISYNTFRGMCISNINDRSLPETLSDMANRCHLESASLIFEMSKCIYSEVRSTFLNNYKVKFEGEIMDLKNVVRVCSKSLSPYKQVLGYQLSSLLNLNIYEWKHLPLFRFLKKQSGAGFIWYGEGKLLFMTRHTKIICILINSTVKMMYINENSLTEDLRYFVNELVHVGIRDPFYDKELSNRSETWCVGFRDQFDMQGEITQSNNCNFVYPYVTFINEEINYPELMPRDMRKVTEKRTNDFYYIRLSKDYSYSSMMDDINLKCNRDWFMKYLNVDVPFFKRSIVSYKLSKKPFIGNIEELGYSYVFTHPQKISQLAGNVFDCRNYMPGITLGITECIMANRPNSLRTPYSHRLWRSLVSKYPDSFIKSIYRERLEERTYLLNSYLNKLYYDFSESVKATRTYISEVMALKQFEDIERPGNAQIMLDEFKLRFTPYIVSTIIDIIDECEIFKNYNMTFEDLYYRLLIKREWTVYIIFGNYVYKKFDELNFNDYKNMQMKIGRPWNLLPLDVNTITYFILKVCLLFRKSMEDRISEYIKDNMFSNQTQEFKFRLRFKMLEKLDSRLATVDKFTRGYSKHSKGHLNFNLIFGRRKGIVYWQPTAKLDMHGDANYFEEIENGTRYYDNDDDFYEDLLDQAAECGIERGDIKIRGRQYDVAIAGNYYHALESNTAFTTLYECPCRHINIYVDTFMFYRCRFPSTIILYHPNGANFTFSMDSKTRVTETNGVKINPAIYEKLVTWAHTEMLPDGSLMKCGVEYVHDYEAFKNEAIQKIEEIIQPPDDIRYIEMLGKKFPLSRERIQTVIANYEDDRAINITKVYEPLGTFITDIGLETMIKEVFPQTYLPLLEGKIKLHKTMISSFNMISKILPKNHKAILVRILMSVSIIPDQVELTNYQKSIAYDFIRELSLFIQEPDEKNNLDVNDLLVEETPAPMINKVHDYVDEDITMYINEVKTVKLFKNIKDETDEK